MLPKQVLEIAGIIGMPAALRLVEAFGGTTLHIRHTATRQQLQRAAAMAAVIGEAAAAELLAAMPGESLYIPRCDAALRALRDLQIAAEFEQRVRDGQTAITTVAELARENQLSDRRIWIILKNPPPLPQQDLFAGAV